MRIVSENNIAKVSFLYAIIIVGVMTFSTGALFIVKKINTLEKTSSRLKKTTSADRKKRFEKMSVTSSAGSITAGARLTKALSSV